MPRDHWKYEGALAAPERVGYLPKLPLPHHDPSSPLAIADMADAFGVTHRTLHFYEEKGLLIAARMGPMRVYGADHIRRMAVINACREIDMPIAAIQELLEPRWSGRPGRGGPAVQGGAVVAAAGAGGATIQPAPADATHIRTPGKRSREWRALTR